ncbi:MAG TPA: methylated-DNA--[protein]-cysteine S-methyltransferase [Candidatus Polarisedimenticolia bacterium]|nr:methylated-DNA--[protein]-cysteine S-methyltransferase [Candidatus Polarisedimenticolia bacterium]
MNLPEQDARELAVARTPIGELRLVATSRGLLQVLFPSRSHPRSKPRTRLLTGDDAKAREHLASAMHQLEEYFSGRRRSFDLALDIRGGEYQLRVWRALSEIPYGETRTYGGLARLLGNAQSARAVGLGCATNPLPIIIPCHRVLSSTGSLQGFGGGLWRKRALLHLEQGQEVLSLAE